MTIHVSKLEFRILGRVSTYKQFACKFNYIAGYDEAIDHILSKIHNVLQLAYKLVAAGKLRYWPYNL